MRAITIVTLSAYCIQPINAVQPVRASKKDLKNITVEITGGDGNIISKTTFRRNTDRLREQDRKDNSLYFDWNQGDNTITAYYEPGQGFGKQVSKDAVPVGSEIVISGKTIKIVGRDKKPIQEAKHETIDAQLKRKTEGEWNIVTGTMHLTSNIAKDFIKDPRVEKYPEVLGGTSLSDKSVIPISMQGSTRIYAQPKGGKGKLTTLKDVDVARFLTSSPVIIIDHEGKAKISNETEWLRQEQAAQTREQEKQAVKPEQVEEEELLSVAVMLDFYERIQDKSIKQALLETTERVYDSINKQDKKLQKDMLVKRSRMGNQLENWARAFLDKLDAIYPDQVKKYGPVLKEMIQEMKQSVVTVSASS